MIRRILPVFLFLLPALIMKAQQILTPEEAVSIALKNNYDIMVSQVSADISKANNTAGNAGMLPNIGINATDNFSLNDVHSSLSSGNNIDYSSAHVNAFTGNISLDWNLFDGGKMFVTKKKLGEIETLGTIQFRDKVNQTLFNVIVAYYDVVRQKQQLASVEEVIRYNEERVKILQASFNAGLVPKTDLLQSQIDLNVYLENAILQRTVISNSKTTLNQLLSRDPATPLEVIDTIELNYVPDKDSLIKKLFSSNTKVLSYEKQADIAKLSVRELVAQRYPWLSFNAGYNFLQNDNPAGTVTKNRTYGPQVGGSLTMPLFYGGNIGREIKIARLQQKSAGYESESTKIEVSTQLQNALNNYNHAMQLLKLEKDNAVLAKENLTITMNRLRLGQTTSLEVHQAEDSFVQSLTRMILFQYSAKVSETNLRMLISEL
jgi:outer membrane protein